MKYLSVICLAATVFCSCSGPDKKQPGNKKHKLTFFDSISAQMDLSPAQVKQHFVTDTGFFTHRSAFSGDTVYYPNSNYQLVILRCDHDGVCLEKYLLVYKKNGLKNTSSLLVETDCDIDYGTNYDKLDYKVFNRNQFYTRDAWYEVDSASKVKTIITDQFYQINANGKIDSLKKKPEGVVLPKFVPVDVTDDDK